MGAILNLLLYMSVGTVGGFIGLKLKIPAGTLVGAMVMVIITKLVLSSEWQLPKNYGFVLQILIGVMVGASFHPSLMATFQKLIIPVVLSSIILVATGILIAVLFNKFGLMDMGTGYLGTSPGAMSVLLVMSLENNVNAAVITCFHLFRIIFVVLTAPIILKFFTN